MSRRKTRSPALRRSARLLPGSVIRLHGVEIARHGAHPRRSGSVRSACLGKIARRCRGLDGQRPERRASAVVHFLSLLPTFGTGAGLHAGRGAPDSETVVEGLVRFTLENAYPDERSRRDRGNARGRRRARPRRRARRGLPLTSAGGDFGPLPEPLANLASEARRLELVNLGSEGKRLVAEVAIRAGGERTRGTTPCRGGSARRAGRRGAGRSSR
jgi:hypothetical protein